jgi:hypothetical protein
MYTLHGFFQFAPLIDNTRDQVNPFGELSSDSLTYTKDKSYISNGDYPQTLLVGFHSVKDNLPTQIPSGIGVRALQLGQWLFERAIAGQVTTDPNVLRATLQSEFGGFSADIRLGRILSSGNVRLPEWIEYRDTVTEDHVDNFIKVWFADQSFQAQYPNYIIEVIPPFTPIDDMFLPAAQVRTKVNQMTLSERFEKVQTIRGDYPQTLTLVLNFNYIDPVDDTNEINTPWTVVIYGEAGNNPDLIKAAIVEWILENSDRPKEDWEGIIPDLLLSTEFLIIPNWTQYSVPNLELEAGMYSPIINPQKTQQLLLKLVKGQNYTPEWIAQEVEYTTLIYRSLAVSVLGNPNNRTGITSFYKQFPDYMTVTNDGADFNRMSVRTQEFSIALAELIYEAEIMTPSSEVPIGMSRITRDGIVYLASYFEDILYLTATRFSVTAAATELAGV